MNKKKKKSALTLAQQRLQAVFTMGFAYVSPYILMLFIAFFGIGLPIMLLVEYRFFCRQSERVLEMQEEYQANLLAIKRVLVDYNRAKERIDELESLVEQGKDVAREVGTPSSSVTAPFGEGVRVYATDDAYEEPEFIVLNRDLGYLRQETFAFLKTQNLVHLSGDISDTILLDYTQQLQDSWFKPTVDKRRVRKKDARTYSGKKLQRNYCLAEDRLSVRDMQLSWPLAREHFWLSSLYGARKKSNGDPGFHYGIDMAALKGTSVKAAASGVIIEAQRTAGYGNTIVIAHNRKYRTRYAHLDSIVVRVGQRVERSALIGYVGDTGFVRKTGKDASHLHFEVSVFGKRINPLYVLLEQVL